MTLVAPVAWILSNRIGNLPLILWGLAGTALGFLTIRSIVLDPQPGAYVLRLLPVGVIYSLFSVANNRNIMRAAPKAQLGIVSVIFNLMCSMRQVVGNHILGVFLALQILDCY